MKENIEKSFISQIPIEEYAPLVEDMVEALGSQRAVGRALGLHYNTICRRLKGEQIIRKESMLAIETLHKRVFRNTEKAHG